MIKFGSIEQFRNVIKEVRLHHDYQGKNDLDEPTYQHLTDYPVIKFHGTVKMHGTNSGIVLYKDGRIEFQSRERVLSLQSDNYQFCLQMSGKNLQPLFENIEFEEHIAIFGEWCGSGVQQGVALSQVPRMFVIFAYQVDGKWLDLGRSLPDQGIHNVLDFPTWEMDIDFEQPEMAQNRLGELTIVVEEECPVGKYFGVSGVGEGIVWSADYNGHRYQFKVKGTLHSSTKVRTLASVDIDSIQAASEFVDSVLTESRLNQGLEFLKSEGKPANQVSTGDFLRFVVGDVIKEETDTIVANQLDPKKINSEVSKKARQWYFKNLIA
jgi:RNA ligase